MELKKEIEILLKGLKEKGFDRADIEQELGYSENYIDQVLAKGGNRRFLKTLINFADTKLQKAISGKSGSDIVLQGPTNATLQDYINLLEKNDAFFKEAYTQLTANLTALVTMVSSGHRSELVYHEVMLRALARLEKKNLNALIEEARNIEADVQKKALNRGMKSEIHT